MRVSDEVFRSAYRTPPGRVQVSFKQPSLTQQHFKDECDINQIMNRYRETGFLVDPLARPTEKLQFGDFSTPFDYMEAMNTVVRANEAFAGLPANLRKRFNNDPAELLAFVSDESNVDEAVKLGLMEKRPSAVVDQPTVVDPPPAQQVSAGGTAAI